VTGCTYSSSELLSTARPGPAEETWPVTNVFIRKGRQERLQTKTCSSKSKGKPLRHRSCPFLTFVGKKYIDPIIAATWSEDGAIHDVCKALSPRFREPNSIVSLLISFHSVSRGTRLWADTSSGGLQGSHRPPYNDSEWRNRQYTSILVFVRCPTAKECRRWPMGRYELCPCSPPNSSLCPFQPAHTFLSGYNAPKNLQHYALYLDTRIRAYRDLKHDAIRVQSETNRDIRLSMSIEEDARQSRKYTPEEDRFQSSSDSSRRKTIMGRKLRVMTVEKGLLRETKVVQKMMDSLIECKVSFNICLSWRSSPCNSCSFTQFYLDDLEDQLSLTALRMLVKDLLILFQAVNEGVINVLGEGSTRLSRACLSILNLFRALLRDVAC